MTTMMSKKEFPFKLEDFDDNPWSVEDASAFLKYVCPECEYNNQTLQAFTEHALENHTKAKIFFTAETIAEQFKLDLIKNEDPEYFEYENYDCFEPANFSAASDYYPNSATLSPKPDVKPTKSDLVKIEDPDHKDDFFDDNNHEDPGNLLKGIDKKTVKREGIEPIKRVFTYVVFSVQLNKYQTDL